MRDADRAPPARLEVTAGPARSDGPMMPANHDRPDDDPEETPGPLDASEAFLERAWRSLSRWAVPVMMSLAYVLLAETSETDTTGKIWMAVGFGFVMVVWFVFRALTDAAALSRALSIGDTTRLLELSERHLARVHKPAVRARYLVARGLARLVRGEFAEALAAVEAAESFAELAPLAEVVRIAALLELGRPVGDLAARGSAAADGRRSPALVWLAEAQLAWRDRDLELADPRLARVIDDIRAGSASRAIAHVYAARIAEIRGDLAGSARHRAAAAQLAAPDAAWLRG